MVIDNDGAAQSTSQVVTIELDDGIVVSSNDGGSGGGGCVISSDESVDSTWLVIVAGSCLVFMRQRFKGYFYLSHN